MKYNFAHISDVITEMAMKKASLSELRRIIVYSTKLIDCEKAYIDNDIQGLIEKYCAGDPVELTEREKAYVDNDIKACAEKRMDLNAEFARVLADGGPEYHANDYVHFKENDGIHFGRVMSYNPATMEYRVYELNEGTMYLVAAKNIITDVSIGLAKELKEEVKKDGEGTEE